VHSLCFLSINLNILFILSLCPCASSADPSSLLTPSLLIVFLILKTMVYNLLNILHNDNIKDNAISTLTSMTTPFQQSPPLSLMTTLSYLGSPMLSVTLLHSIYSPPDNVLCILCSCSQTTFFVAPPEHVPFSHIVVHLGRLFVSS